MTVGADLDRTLRIALALNAGVCDGTYTEACLLLSALISSSAARVWPDRGGDRRRFIEAWVRFSDPSGAACRISVPLLSESLVASGRHGDALAIQALRPALFAPGEDCRIVTGDDIDVSEAEVLSACPRLGRREIRAYSYPSLFYAHVRSALVHELRVGSDATAWPMTTRAAGVSYSNELVGHDAYSSRRTIHFHIPWLCDLLRSMSARIAELVPAPPLPPPMEWWIAVER